MPRNPAVVNRILSVLVVVNTYGCELMLPVYAALSGQSFYVTLFSRILGFVRDTVIARAFGAGMATDAFFVAFKIPNFLRRLFAEGAFSQAFVPIMGEYKNRRGEPELGRAVHAAGLLRSGVRDRVETGDLATEPNRLSGGVEARDGRDAAAPGEEAAPVVGYVQRQRVHRAQPGDDHPPTGRV